MQSFIFGQGTENLTPQELQRRREMVTRLQERSTATTPRTFGEGLTAIGQALAGRIQDRRIGAMEEAERTRAGSAFESIIGQLSGGGSPFAAPGGMPSGGGSPFGGGQMPTGGGTPRPSSGPVDADMERRIYEGLTSRGMPDAVARGVIANMIAESRLQPGINEAAPLVPGSRGGFGLNQWTGPRRRALEAAAAQRGVPVDDLDFQLDFTMEELQGPEARAWQAMQGAADPVQAARMYSDLFLRPGIPHMDRRLSEAQRLAQAQFGPAGGDMQAVAASGPVPAADQAAPMQAPMRPGAALPPQQQPMPQPAQGGNMAIIQQLSQLASNPYLPEGQRMVAQALIQQQMQAMQPPAPVNLQTVRTPDGGLASFNPRTGELTPLMPGQEGGDRSNETFGLQPVWGEDADGNTVMLQMSNRGGVTRVEVPDGVRVSAGGVQRVDLGTAWGILDRDGRVIQTIPKAQVNAAGEFVAPAPDSDPTNPANLRGGVVEGSEAARRRSEAEGEAATTAARRMDTMSATTRIVTTATDNALSAAGRGGSGTMSGIIGMLPFTESAEVGRQLATLRAQARIGNLTAMREASPTGGALGAVSDAEGRMLEDASGALDPRAPTFQRDLLNYTRTLLGVVHGAQAGDELFFQLYGPQAAEQGIAPNAPSAVIPQPPPAPATGGMVTPATIATMTREQMLDVDVMSLDSEAFEAYERRWNELRGGR